MKIFFQKIKNFRNFEKFVKTPKFRYFHEVHRSDGRHTIENKINGYSLKAIYETVLQMDF